MKTREILLSVLVCLTVAVAPPSMASAPKKPKAEKKKEEKKPMTRAEALDLIEAHAATLTNLRNSLALDRPVAEMDMDTITRLLIEADKLVLPKINKDIKAIHKDLGKDDQALAGLIQPNIDMMEAMDLLRSGISNGFVSKARAEYDTLKDRPGDYLLGRQSPWEQDLRLALIFMPKNKEAAALKAAFGDEVHKALEAGREQVAQTAFPEQHADPSEGDLEDLVESALAWFKASEDWGAAQAAQKVIAAAVAGDWVVVSEGPSGKQWGLPLDIAVQDEWEAENGFARRLAVTLITSKAADIDHAMPWTHARIDSRDYMLAEKALTPDTRFRSLLAWLAWLFVALLNLLAGALLLVMLAKVEIPGLSLLGLACVALGALGGVVFLISLAPLQGIIPQIMLMLAGLALFRAQWQSGNMPVHVPAPAFLLKPVLLGPLAIFLGLFSLISANALYLI